jgi:nucleotide-binding universal stress UspA family protein
MRWIIGLDLRPLSHGALEFAAWLSAGAAAASAEPPRFVPVHVLEEDHLLAVLRHHHLDEVVAAARDEARRALERHGRAAWLEDLRVVQALQANESLEEARASAGADAIVIGRAAGRDERRVVRLGRVARRLLRALPAPVVVVPPDLRASDVGTGPVVALTAAAGDAVDAIRFAEDVARRAGRKLAVVHVARDPAGAGLPFVPAVSLGRAREDELREARARLDAWIAAEGLRPDATAVLQGNLIEQAIGYAEAQASPLLVVGARRREGVDRVLVPSVGRELAASSTVPVAVVPAGV